MKKFIMICLASTSAYVSYSQKAPEALKNTNECTFQGQYFQINSDAEIITVKDNVKVDLGALHVEADSAIFSERDQSLIAYQIKRFTFKGGEAVISDHGKNNTLRYKLNDKSIYLE